MNNLAITSQDILNEIDLDKIGINNDKRKRGRPKKVEVLKLPPKIELCNNSFDEEIILRLPLTSEDLNIINNSINNSINKDMENSDKDSSDTDLENNKNNNKNEVFEFSNMNINQLCSIIVKQTKEIKQLKTYITDITPMFCTEVKEYPIDLKVCNSNGNIITPKHTTICCWWCTYTFSDLPVYLPEKYYNSKYYVFGNFCSFNCTASYNRNLNDSRVLERYTLLKQIYYLIHKNIIKSVKDIEINLADRKEKLIKYGGPQTIEEFRQSSKILKREYYNMIPPLGGINLICSEVTNSENMDSINIYNFSEKNSKSQNAKLKIKN